MPQVKVIIFLLIVLSTSTNCGRPSGDVGNEEKIAIIDPVIAQPTFPGDADGLRKYLRDNYRWRQGQLTVEGTVYVRFIVLEDGTVSSARIFRGLCETCDAEALRLIRSMPKWIPASDNGKPIAERVILPIKFGVGNPYE